MTLLTDTIALTEFRDRAGDAVNAVAYGENKRIGITRHGKVAAVLISVNELELLDAIEDAADRAALAAVADDDDVVPWEDVAAELDALDAQVDPELADSEAHIAVSGAGRAVAGQSLSSKEERVTR